MRFSASAFALALPVFAAAEGSVFDQYKAQFQNFIGNMGAKIPNAVPADPVGAAEAKVGSMKMSVLTLDNWRSTLYEPVSATTKKPEEWWVLITGGNKTCFGHCGGIEKAFNESAAKLALSPGSPHVGYLNCEDEPVLCNSWSANAGNLWIFEMLPPPAAIDIYTKRLNLSSLTADDLVTLHATDNKSAFQLLDSWFHPFDGKAVEFGLAVPFGYAMWAFGLVPNWLFMLIVSFASRSMMSNRMGNMNDRRAGGAAPAGAAAPAQ